MQPGKALTCKMRYYWIADSVRNNSKSLNRLMIQRYINSLFKDVWAWKKLVLTLIFLALLFFWKSSMMLHNIWDSPFNYKGADITYWIIYWLKLDVILTSGYGVSLMFSMLLLSINEEPPRLEAANKI